MINIEEFIANNITNRSAQYIADKIYSFGLGEAKDYNVAVYGIDVKDSIVQLALLLWGYLGAAGEDFRELTDLSEMVSIEDGVVYFDGHAVMDQASFEAWRYVDNKISLSPKAAEDNAFDLLRLYGNCGPSAYAGVTYEWVELNKAFVLSGASSGSASVKELFKQPTLPDWLVPGKTYHVTADNEYHGGAAEQTSGLNNRANLRFTFWSEENPTDSTPATYKRIYQNSTSFTVPEDAKAVAIHIVVAKNITVEDEHGNTILRYAMYSTPSNAELEAELLELATGLAGDISELGAELETEDENAAALIGMLQDTVSAIGATVEFDDDDEDDGGLKWEEGGFSNVEGHRGEEIDDPAFVRTGMIPFTQTLVVTYPSTMRVGALYETYVLAPNGTDGTSPALMHAFIQSPTENLIISNKNGKGKNFHPAYLRLYAKWADGRPLTVEEAEKYILLQETAYRLDSVVEKEIIAHPNNMIMHGGKYWCDAEVEYTRDQRFGFTNVITKKRMDIYKTHHSEPDPKLYPEEHAAWKDEYDAVNVPTGEEKAIFNRMVLCSNGDLELPFWATRILIHNPDGCKVQIHSHNAGRWSDVLVSTTAEWSEYAISTREKKVMLVLNQSDTYEMLPMEACRVRLYYEAVLGQHSSSSFDAGLYRESMQVYHPDMVTLREMPYLNIRGLPKDVVSDYNTIPEGYRLNSIPYSSRFSNGGDVGFNRSYGTFCSAVLNPHSKLYDDKGGVYKGDGSLGGAATFYGSVCSTLAQMMLGFDAYYGSAAVNRNFRHRKVNVTDFRQMKPGMMLSSDDHEIVVMDVYYDANGEERLNIYEAAKPFMSASTITSRQLFDKYLPSYGVYDTVSGEIRPGSYPSTVGHEYFKVVSPQDPSSYIYKERTIRYLKNDIIEPEYGSSLYYSDMPVRIRIPKTVGSVTVDGVLLAHLESKTGVIVSVQESDFHGGVFAVIDITEATNRSGRWWMQLMHDGDVIEGAGKPTELYRQMHVSQYTPRPLATAKYATDVICEYGNDTWLRAGEDLKLYIKPTGQNEVTIDDTVVTIPTYPRYLYQRRKGNPNWTVIDMLPQIEQWSADPLPAGVTPGVYVVQTGSMSSGLYEYTTNEIVVTEPDYNLTTAKIFLFTTPTFTVESIDNVTGEAKVTVSVDGMKPVYATQHFVTTVTDEYDFHDENDHALKYIHSLKKPYPVAKSYAFYDVTETEPNSGAYNGEIVFSLPVGQKAPGTTIGITVGSDGVVSTYNLPAEGDDSDVTEETVPTPEAEAERKKYKVEKESEYAPVSPLTVVLRSFFDTGFGLTYVDKKFVLYNSDPDTYEWSMM